MHPIVKAVVLIPFVYVLGCIGKPPTSDYNLAYAAVEAAKGAQAAKFAPSLWSLAERSYLDGQEHYKRERYREAERAFVRARAYAEKAENISRLKRFETGDGAL